ncbi:MAG: putative baseplate assembly protein [Candidatus Methanoperedens sp.]|nr:putative baseplate assembly protein [Candidatus Methanoperedens sp.]
MTIDPPKIDSRDQQMLFEQVRDLALYYCPEWKDAAAIESDKYADSLMHIFSRMMEIIIQRLNKVPDKNFLTFLDMVGTSLFPPRVATAPLTFTMAKGETKYRKIPCGTQAATAQTKEKEAIVFETTEDITIIPQKLVGAVSLSPDEDKWADQTAVLSGNTTEDVVLFKGKELVPHRLYLGNSELFSFKEKAVITLDITLKSDIAQAVPWEVKWYYFDENLAPKYLDVAAGTDKNVAGLLKSGSFSFEPVGGISEKTLIGRETQKNWTKHWIYAELNTPIPKENLPLINTIKASISIPGSTVPPDLAFFNNFQIDLTKDFYPFGERPKFNDTLYIGSKEVFSKKDAIITLKFNFSLGVDSPDTEAITLVWEFWDGNSWKTIYETTQLGVPAEKGDYKFTDTTNAFTFKATPEKKEATVKFTCPEIEEKEINGEKNNWVRVRIIDGDYGKDASYDKISIDAGKGTGKITSKEKIVTGSRETKFKTELSIGDSIIAAGQTRIITSISIDTSLTIDSAFDPDLGSATDFTIKKTGWIYRQLTYKPPSISNLALEYSFNLSKKDLEIILTYNDFIYHDETEACKGDNKTFTPFQPVADTQQAVYLAFDQDISTLPVTIFFPLLENMFTVLMAPESYNPPVLAWEYWTGRTWSLLSVEDGTRNLTKMEMIQFLAPDDVEKRYCFEFGTEYYWIRARLDKGKYDNLPRLKGIYTNTVWAYNRITVDSEILGSSNGKTGQVFNFSHFPVLPGQKVIVREISLTEEEKSTIRLEEGRDAIEEIKDDDGNVIGYWVRWHERNYLYSSGPYSRHYIIDRNKGMITFGDGVMGMIPPAEKDNIRCSYQYGGGVNGNNVGVQSITKLRTAFPFVESVTNYEDSDGGEDRKDLDWLRERGPQTIKHRDRAVTYEDFEWLVREASPKVAKVKCLPTTDPGRNFRPGWITMIIVPDERENPKPIPGRGLINEIQDYIFNRTSTYLTTCPSQINLVGPGYIKVGVEAKVHFISVADAKIIEGRIIENLKRFFHPLTGGPEKEGWDFGRNVYISQVYEVIESTDGVDYVDGLTLNASVQVYKLTLTESLILSDSYPENSRIERSDGKLSFSLAEKLPEEEIDTLTVVGFKEGDSIILSHQDKSANLVIRSVSHDGMLGDILECEPSQVDDVYPAGSIVKTSDERIKSFTLNEVPEGDISLNPLKISILNAGDSFVLSLKDDPSKRVTGVIKKVSNSEKIFIENNYLVYSGEHAINTKPKEELAYRYLMNTNTKEIHDLNRVQPNCNLDQIQKDHMIFTRTLDKIDGYDYCGWCFGPEMSKR